MPDIEPVRTIVPARWRRISGITARTIRNIPQFTANVRSQFSSDSCSADAGSSTPALEWRTAIRPSCCATSRTVTSTGSLVRYIRTPRVRLQAGAAQLGRHCLDLLDYVHERDSRTLHREALGARAPMPAAAPVIKAVMPVNRGSIMRPSPARIPLAWPRQPARLQPSARRAGRPAGPRRSPRAGARVWLKGVPDGAPYSR